MMNRLNLVMLIAVLLAMGQTTRAQGSAPSNVQVGGKSASLASGTTLIVILNGGIDSKKAKTGDPVSAHTIEPVKEDGRAVMPSGTKLVGHVTQATARGKGDADSTLSIQFDKAVLKNGQEIPLRVWIRAMAAEQREASQPDSDRGVLAGTGSAAEAGSPMKPTHTIVSGVNDSTGPAGGASGTNGSSDNTPGASRGLNAAGQLTPSSRGVFGVTGLQLDSEPASAAGGSRVTSYAKSVHLDSGTRLLLVSQAADSAASDK
jgi:hypothetical protein